MNLGRFSSEDPAKDGFNWYSYCENNPLKYIDPKGELSNDPNDYKSDQKTTVVTNDHLKLTAEGQVKWTKYQLSLSGDKNSTSSIMKGVNVGLTGAKTYAAKKFLEFGKSSASVAVPIATVDLILGYQQQKQINQLNCITKLISI